jgi:hypothetical protein
VQIYETLPTLLAIWKQEAAGPELARGAVRCPNRSLAEDKRKQAKPPACGLIQKTLILTKLTKK